MPRRREPTGRQRACTHTHAAMEGWGTLPSHSWNEAAPSTHAQTSETCSFSTRVSYQSQPAQLAQLAQLSESDSARAHTRQRTQLDQMLREQRDGSERNCTEHTHTCGRHSDGTNCNRYLTSAIHVPSLSRAKSSAWVVAAGRLLCLAEPHTPARVFLGPAHRTLGGPHRCVFNNPIIPTHLPLLEDEQPR